MVTREDIAEYNEDALFIDGFDEPLIGMAERINLGPVAAYSYQKIIEILMERDGMDYTEEVEYHNFNIVGAWVGEFTPIIIQTEF